jgi:hypothetical protein
MNEKNRIDVAFSIARLLIGNKEFAAASDWLKKILPEFESIEQFWKALVLADIADITPDNIAVDEISNRMLNLFPECLDDLVQWRVNRFINWQDYAKAASESEKSELCKPLSNLFQHLAISLNGTFELNYSKIFTETDELPQGIVEVTGFGDYARGLVCKHALNSNRGDAVVQQLLGNFD